MFQTKPTFVGSKSKLLTRLATRPIPAMLQNTHMGRFSPDHALAETGDFRTRTTLRQGKNVACERGGLIGLCFRGTLSRKL
jgi:hypothetical protein